MKVTIVGGAGGVGASTAFNLIRDGLDAEVVLVDARPAHITSHVMDLEQTLELLPGSSIREGDDGDIQTADVLVLSASAPLTLNTSRLSYLDENARTLDRIASALRPGWAGVVVVVTNPVDPLVTRFASRAHLDRRRVLGYTLNDSLRLRTGVARALGTTPGNVDAWVIGEHGDASVPLWSRLYVDGRPLLLAPDQAAAAEAFLRTWYVRHVALDSGRSSTWTSGLGVARMVAAILEDTHAIWPASVVLDGEYGIEGVAVTVPVELGADGAVSILEWGLASAELEGLLASAEVVRQAVERLATDAATSETAH